MFVTISNDGVRNGQREDPVSLQERFLTAMVLGDTDTFISLRGTGGMNRKDLSRIATPRGGNEFTVHAIGWIAQSPGRSFGGSTLMYWKNGYCFGWDMAETFVGGEEPDNIDDSGEPTHHNLIVPASAWQSDPSVHVVDWINPDEKIDAESVYRRRRDRNLLESFGFSCD